MGRTPRGNDKTPAKSHHASHHSERLPSAPRILISTGERRPLFSAIIIAKRGAVSGEGGFRFKNVSEIQFGISIYSVKHSISSTALGRSFWEDFQMSYLGGFNLESKCGSGRSAAMRPFCLQRLPPWGRSRG